MEQSQQSLGVLLLCLCLLMPTVLWAGTSETAHLASTLKRLGFVLGTMTPVQGDWYRVEIRGFKPTGALILTGSFTPFSLEVSAKPGKVLLPKSELQQRHFRIRRRALPAGVVVQDIPIPSFGKRPSGPVSAGDPVFLRLRIALATARTYQRNAAETIDMIRVQVGRATRAIGDCPVHSGTASGSKRAEWKELDRVFTFVSPLKVDDQLYLESPFTRCEDRLEDVTTAQHNAEKHFRYLKCLLTEVHDIQAYVSERCRSPANPLLQSEKDGLENALASLRRDAEGETDDFDRFVADIERFIAQFRNCAAGTPEQR